MSYILVSGKAAIGRFLNIPAILAMSLIFAGSAVSQQTTQLPPASPDVTPVIRVSSQFVVLDALAENRKTGNLVDNLKAEDFQVAEDGNP